MKEPARVSGGRALEAVFEITRRQGRAALIPFISAGDPDIVVTEEVLTALVQGGADVIELGIPFSDPVADGPTIQAASERALAEGITLENVLDLVGRFTIRHSVPVILFGYFNPVLAFGEKEFAERAREVGASGALLVDLAFEESHGFRGQMRENQLHFISLIAPTTPLERAARIARASSGFLYYVSMTGVTGRALSDLDVVEKRVAAIRETTNLPIAVGFGVKKVEDVRAVARFADGVVVGSELVRRIHEAGPSHAPAAARDYIHALSRHTKR